MASMRVAFVVAIMCMVVVSSPMAEAGRGALVVERLESGDGSLLPLLVLLVLIM